MQKKEMKEQKKQLYKEEAVAHEEEKEEEQVEAEVERCAGSGGSRCAIGTYEKWFRVSAS